MPRIKLMRHGILFGNLLFSFATAITLFTNSSFIEKSVGMTWTAIMYAVSSAIGIIILSNSKGILRKYGNRMFFLFYGTLYALSLGVLSLPFSDTTKIVALLIYLFSTNIIIFSLNIFFAHLADKEGRGNLRGIFLLLGNVGTMLGPLIATNFIDFAGFSGMYMAALIIFTILTIVISSTFITYIDPKYLPQKTHFAIHHTLKEKTLRNVVAANFILQFFYAWMVIYTPIYLTQYLGFSWDSVGIIFTVMLTTFVILDYPLGKLADWLRSEKELCAIGFFIMTVSVFALAFFSTPSVLTVGIILFLSRVGAATVEAMTEIHFYKIAQDSDPGLISLFCDLRPLAYIIAPILGAIAIIFLPFKTIFIVLGCILILGFIISFYMEKSQKLWIPEHEI